MENKNQRTRILFMRLLPVLLFCLGMLSMTKLTPSLYAQTAGFFIDKSSDEPRFIQRLAWSGEYALRYEVIIEKEENGRYISSLREFTNELYIDVSLSPGNYRFRVIPYDILDRPSEGSQWMYIEIRLALKPVLYDSSQEFFFSEDDQGYRFIFSGMDISPDAEIFFIHRNDEQILPVEIISSDDGRSVTLIFDKDQLEAGEFSVIIRNPGGLEAVMHGIIDEYSELELEQIPGTVQDFEPVPGFAELDPEPELKSEPEQEYNIESEPDQLKPVIWNLGAAFMPVIPIYGEVSGNSLFLGTAVRISAAFITPVNIHIGPELKAAWYMNDAAAKEHVLSVGLNILVMKWLPGQSAALNFRLGVDYIILPQNQNSIQIAMGASFHWRFFKQLFMEAGLDYIHLQDEYSFGGLQPWIGFGCHF